MKHTILGFLILAFSQLSLADGGVICKMNLGSSNVVSFQINQGDVGVFTSDIAQVLGDKTVGQADVQLAQAYIGQSNFMAEVVFDGQLTEIVTHRSGEVEGEEEVYPKYLGTITIGNKAPQIVECSRN